MLSLGVGVSHPRDVIANDLRGAKIFDTIIVALGKFLRVLEIVIEQI
jgi:hypothetical protein